MGDRADLGFGSELDGFDPADWTPKPKPRPKAASEDRAATRQMAEATGFRSREPAERPSPAPAPTKPPQRRRRTGRNMQFNIKARAETIEAFCAVADAQGWGLGETLEHAVALLRKHHPAGKGRG